MGGFFGAVCKQDAISDVFFGTDYHSHLGNARGGMAAWNAEIGLQRDIHNIQNSPFRTKFEHIFDEMQGNSAIGIISDTDPQPLLMRSNLGAYAICMVGAINNASDLIERYLSSGTGQFTAMTGGRVNSTELIASLINQKTSFAEGIAFAQEAIEGTASVLILKEGGSLIAARDRLGRIPVFVGRREDEYCVTFESFAAFKLGYEIERELGPGEIVEISQEGVKQLKAPGKEMKICAFLWSYYGYPTSTYEGVNVETMRYRNGEIMAETDEREGVAQDLDYVSGVPDSGTPHAIGYANRSRFPFARPYIKYTPTWARSFTPQRQVERNKVAKMKQIPIHELIEDKNLLFVDDSIVRGTTMANIVRMLREAGATAVHVRISSPPFVSPCYYGTDVPSKDLLIACQHTIPEICEILGADSLGYLEVDSLGELIGDKDHSFCDACFTGDYPNYETGIDMMEE